MKSDDFGTIGGRIAALRKTLGLKQADLAGKLIVSRELVNLWESNRRQIKGDDIARLADALGTTCDYILRGVSTQNLDIHAATGLSEKAINRILLETAPMPGEFVPESEFRRISVLDTLLTSSEFWRIVRLLGGYVSAPKQNLSKAAGIYQEYRLINNYGVEEKTTMKDVWAYKAQRAFAALLDELDSNSEGGIINGQHYKDD